MGIKIQHGGRGSDAAGQILAQAGQGEANRQSQEAQALLRLAGAARPGPTGGGGGGGGGGASYDEKAMKIRELNSTRAMQTERIQAQAKRDTQAADDATARTALEFGLDEQIREQEFDNALKAKQEEARQAANEWELHYSPQQLQEVSRRNNSNQMIASALQRGEIAPEEAAQMTAANNSFIDNMQPGRRPADPNKPKFEDGKPPNSTYINESGTEYQVQSDGTHEMKVRPDQSKEHHQAVAQAKVDAASLLREQAIEDIKADTRIKAMEAHTKFLYEYEGPSSGSGDSFKPGSKLSIDEIERRKAKWEQDNPTPEQQRAAEQQAIQQQQADVELRAVIEEASAGVRPGEEFTLPDGTVLRKKPKPFVSWRERNLPLRTTGVN